LQKAKAGARRAFISSLQSSLGRANAIGQYATYYNDANLINTRIDKVTAVAKKMCSGSLTSIWCKPIAQSSSPCRKQPAAGRWVARRSNYRAPAFGQRKEIEIMKKPRQ
jgi:hypothetical protein